jgi:hypothetical protein
VPSEDASATQDTSVDDDASERDATSVPLDGAVDGAASDAQIDQTNGACEAAPGMKRVGTLHCGFCGFYREECRADGLWHVDINDCAGGGECVPGSIETRKMDYCGTEQRTCYPWCNWAAWEVTAPDTGACAWGTTTVTNYTDCDFRKNYWRVCTDECVEVSLPECGGTCRGERRTSPAWAEETCVIGGSIPRVLTSGVPEWDSVVVSPYFIDKYPVTFRRYQLCVDAGVCSPLTPFYSPSFQITLRDTADHPDSPVWTATFAQAQAFCAWDGGRVLPTGAQYQFPSYAAGGYDLIVGCDAGSQQTFDRCNSNLRLELGRIYDRYDEYDHLTDPGLDVRLLSGSFVEWIDEWYQTGPTGGAVRYPKTGPRHDPTGPASGTLRAVSGRLRQAVDRDFLRDVWGATHRWPEQRAQFRCARPTQLELPTP